MPFSKLFLTNPFGHPSTFLTFEKNNVMYLTDRELFYRHLAVPAEVPEALEIVRAEGIYLYDDLGNEYVDLVSGVSVSNVGHQHPAVVEAVKEQAEKYMHLMVYGKYIQSPQVRLAGRLAENLPPSLDSDRKSVV